MSTVVRLIWLVAATVMVGLASAADPPSVMPDSASILETVLRTEYPQVTRWQLQPVAASHAKRRPFVLSTLDGGIEVSRDADIYFVKSATASSRQAYRVAGYQSVVVATRYLFAHQLLQLESTTTAERDLFSLSCAPLIEALDTAGSRLRRAVKPAAVLCAQDVEAQPMIARDQTVTIRCELGTVHIAATGVALSDGHRGQTIQVRRQGQYRTLHATVIQEGEVNACI